jgi:hypothetical protein
MFSTGWTIQNGSIGANVALSPTGTLTADKLIPDTTTSQHRILQLINFTGPGVFSVYAKADGYNFLSLGSGGGVSGGSIYFNLSNGTISGSAGGVTPLIENVGNGWYRCSIQNATLGAGVNLSYLIVARQAATTADYAGNGTDGILIWGAQLVEGTDAKPYFATTNRQDVPRLDYRNADGSVSSCPRLLLEPQRTNSIRNSSMVGAVAGTPGTLPTNWAQIGSGLSRTIIGTGIENGLQYIELRYNGTATANVGVYYDAVTQISALTGQAWAHSIYVKVISGTYDSASLAMLERTSAGGAVKATSQTIVPTANLERFTYARTLDGGATVAAVQPYISFGLTVGATYDFTIRIAAPQMELGAYATTFIPTTTAAVTRLADLASKTGVSSLLGQTEGTLFLDFESGANDGANYFFTINDNTSSNRIGFSRNASNQLATTMNTAGIGQGSVNTTTLTANTRYKAAIVYSTDNVSLWVNGSIIATDTTATIPSTSAIRLDNGAGVAPWHRDINQAAIFTRRLTNAEVAQITTI